MGIYDRDYYRDNKVSFLGSFADRGLMCKWLIGINVVAFVVQLITKATPEMFENLFSLQVDAALRGQVWRLITYSFLHSTGTPYHILFNMLFLWWFGSDVEDLYGPREFLAFYLVSAALGGVAFVLTNLTPPLPGDPVPVCFGASGAVTTVLVLCALHYPTRIILLFFILPVPIWLFVIFMVAQDMFGFLGGTAGNIAVQVHLAGALFGFLYYKFQWRLTNWLPRLKNWRRRLTQPRLRVYREEEPAPVARVPPPSLSRPDEDQLEAKVDAVLEKLSRVGKENLTDSEREVLLRASEVFRKRKQ